MITVKTKFLPVPKPDIEFTLSYEAARCLRDMLQNGIVSEDPTIRQVREATFTELHRLLGQTQSLPMA